MGQGHSVVTFVPQSQQGFVHPSLMRPCLILLRAEAPRALDVGKLAQRFLLAEAKRSA
jgi:hypothetical protein